MARRHEISDEQWDLIPGRKSAPGQTGRNNRLSVNAVLFVLKTGIRWEDLPARYGKPNTVWERYDRWCARGVWERLFLAMGESDMADELQEIQIDSTSIKAHPVASTGRRLADKKRGCRRKTLSGPFSRRADNENSRSDRQEWSACRVSTDGRSTRRGSAGRTVAGRLQTR